MTGLSIYIICNLLWFLNCVCKDDTGSVQKTIDQIYEEVDHNNKSLALVEIILVLVMAFISIPGTIVLAFKRRNK